MAPADAFDAMALDDLEEAAGELHRRISAALRRIGEAQAEQPDGEQRTPRWRVASLAAALELACASLAAVAAGGGTPDVRHDRHPALVSALMYAAPSIPALLTRVDQDRRLLASFSRSLDSRLGEPHVTPWGHISLRRLLSEVAIAEPARCAQALERRLAILEAEAEARARAEAAHQG
ncbi:MAG: hypothetical protein FJZ92_00305 [Chloroflexi bacterium]|nr:hypothetical protein [Chloroflexota bacterium]